MTIYSGLGARGSGGCAGDSDDTIAGRQLFELKVISEIAGKL